MKSQLQIAIVLVLTVIVAVALSVGATHYIKLRDAAAQGALDKGKLETTEGVLEDSDAADEERDQFDNVVGSARDNYERQVQEDRRNEPETRTRADRVVPDSVRRAYRERRIARERLVRNGSGNDTGAEGTDAPQR